MLQLLPNARATDPVLATSAPGSRGPTGHLLTGVLNGNYAHLKAPFCGHFVLLLGVRSAHVYGHTARPRTPDPDRRMPL